MKTINPTTTLLLLLATPLNILAQDQPLPPEKMYSDPVVIECISQGTKGMSEKFKALEEKGYALSRHGQSIAPVVLERRRLQEEWCAVEAKCVTNAVPKNRQLIYGETFAMCLRQARQ